MPHTKILKQFFGYDNFRTGQDEIIQNILNKKDSLGIMPTGAGKSLCFQVPALMFDGITIVISPLISLMKDQVATLVQLNIPAAFINSSLTDYQVSLALSRAREGKYKIIYVAPERLLSYDFLSLANSCEISMVTVDEAHCISKWGQDFRPSYSKIPEFIEKLPTRPVVCAFTATATKDVGDDIVNILKLDNPYVLTTGFNRENLFFDVLKPKNKFDTLIGFLSDKKDKFGIVYCSTKKTVDLIHKKLVMSGYNAAKYHAGLSDFERNKNQDDFIYDKINIIVATNAFGMGIDKSNVSFVVHYNMPKDIESYYQEAGRAGRDGSSADCILLYSNGDVFINNFLINHSNGNEEIDEETKLILKTLEQKRLHDMNLYCNINECYRAYIINYFGESSINNCSNCGNCNTNFETVDITINAQKILSCVLRLNQKYGIGTVTDVLLGKNNKKIMQLGFDKLPTYGIIDMSEEKLNKIIYYLILNNYLTKTDGKYPILKLGSLANNILYNKHIIQMKLTDDEKYKTPTSKLKQKPMENELFNILKNLRKTIAFEQKVPPFVIFSDVSLTDMCIKTPTTKDEFALINGVGKFKLDKYSDRFLNAIVDYKSGATLLTKQTL